MIFKHKFFFRLILFIFFLTLTNCQLKKTQKNHGIIFLKNRYDKLVVNKTNSNDVVKILGQPHTKSITDESDWIYIERVLTKGKFYRMGSNVIAKNNVVVLTFNKYGILINKSFFDKKKLANLKFSNDVTSNNLSQRSFVQEFLESIRSKMYGNR